MVNQPTGKPAGVSVPAVGNPPCGKCQEKFQQRVVVALEKAADQLGLVALALLWQTAIQVEGADQLPADSLTRRVGAMVGEEIAKREREAAQRAPRATS